MVAYVTAALALAAWFGGGVVAGFVAPQAAFGVLADRAQAGSIAGLVLSRYASLAMVSALIYMAAWFYSRASSRPWPKRTLFAVGVSLAVIALGQWSLTPQIASLRAQMSMPDAPGDLADRFDALHRWSVILFGVQWLLSGVALAMHVGSEEKGPAHFSGDRHSEYAE